MGQPDETGRRDAIAVIIDEHRVVDRLLDRFESLDPDAPEAGEVVHRIAAEVSMQAAIEEEHLYPTLLDRVPEGDEIVREDLEEHRQIGRHIAAVLGASPTDPAFRERAARLTRGIRRHLARVEARALPGLRRGLGGRHLEELGEVLQTAREAGLRPR
jgi:hypothetical protein